MNRINYVARTPDQLYSEVYDLRANKDAFVCYIRGKCCRDYASFIAQFASALQFPEYFGDNWAALDECLTDLDWLRMKEVSIVIDFGVEFLKYDRNHHHAFTILLEEMLEYWHENQEQRKVTLTINLGY